MPVLRITSLLSRYAILGLLLAAGLCGRAFAAEVNQIDGIALHGFDPVAYFTQNRAVKGSPRNTAAYEGVTYEFASPENRALFAADPARYAPQYGGFCAMATAEGVKADIDPYAFAINDGKLYVNFSLNARDAYQNDVAGNTAKADHNWPDVKQQSHVIH